MKLGAAIDIQNLTKKYGSLNVVDQVSLSVAAGEFVSLLGASGSGKTTTLMMVAGLAMPDGGTIRIGGSDISRLPPEQRALGVVFQSYALFPHYTVFDNIAFPLRLRKVAESDVKRQVQDVLEKVGLASFGNRRIAQLSGGQQQRVALARAIVFSPPVLLMDEPLGALDRKLRDQLQTEIKRIHRELGVTVIYVTHDQEEALALSDRVAVMKGGRIDQIGTPDEIYERPVSPFIAGFLGESNFMDVKRNRNVDGNAQVVCALDASKTFIGRLTPDAASVNDLVAVVRPEAIEIAREGLNFDNRMEGVVEQRDFLGATIRLVVQCRAGKMIVRLSRSHLEASCAVGSAVSLTWRSKDMVLFSRAE
ncbi:MAG: ABC transporter ATP-binding protein [Pseudomonadota bacterium]|nr:ABC transporter ATP-binding protein [Pseudomonadota bacterium]